MPGKSKKGGGLKSYSPYKMKGHALPGPKQRSPLKVVPVVAAAAPAAASMAPWMAAAIGGIATGVVGALFGGKSKAPSPNFTNPGEELSQMKMGTGQETSKIT